MTARLFEGEDGLVREVANINAYLVPYKDVYVKNEMKPQNGMAPVVNGSKPVDGGGLVFGSETASKLKAAAPEYSHIVRHYFGAHDATHGVGRYCIWATEEDYEVLKDVPEFKERFDAVTEMRAKSTKPLTQKGQYTP
jgi:MmeI, target recognition domain